MDSRRARRSSNGESLRNGASKTCVTRAHVSRSIEEDESRKVRTYHVLDFVPTRRTERTDDSRGFVETVPTDVEFAIKGATAGKI